MTLHVPFVVEPPKHRGKEALALLDRLLDALPADAPPHLAVSRPPPTTATVKGTGAPLPPPPVAPAPPEQSLPPPPSAAPVSQALGGSAAAVPGDDDDDVNMDLEEGQLAESPGAQPPLPPPETPVAVPPQPPRAPAASAPGAGAHCSRQRNFEVGGHAAVMQQG